MERREFFKKASCAIVGIAVAPFVIKAKEDEIVDCVLEPEFWITKRSESGIIEYWKNGKKYYDSFLEPKERDERLKVIYKPITEEQIKKEYYDGDKMVSIFITN